MRCNANIMIVDHDVVLVPYRSEHVAKYHEWMTSAELRELTASESLSLEEEYEMQRKWREDEDKLTFIVLAARPADAYPPHVTQDLSASSASSSSFVPAIGSSAVRAYDPEFVRSLSMIGDVNMFLKNFERTHEGGQEPIEKEEATEEEDAAPEAEVEIMIAEPAYRRHGLASCTLQLFLGYTLSSHALPVDISPRHLVVRISETNAPSIRLFERLGWEVVKRVEVFGEVEMRVREDVLGEKR
ncbi:uncharacterized protein LAESUDRAFT_94660 [Laetiporus sulphureus 93-53]|uniref:N-acetyltransferase domain-containing protein n=1 Tax=Laetiporus sulphureus 93-53 TaxID=1314785 RepID=A0A165ATV4_9APHY|nr:uncharacterized protein LAESUDRAFT_94660 [Laetiporus sulphureus 93-53]KZS99652.1 hypothetical protein LAESUDRAFT_94660 [Laetiporus sulphureus 93-53]